MASEVTWLICCPFSQSTTVCPVHQPAFHICVCVCVWQNSECFGLRPCPWINACSYVSICLHAHFSACVLFTRSGPLFSLFFMYWKLFLEWPSKSHGVQPCCLCAPACVIQFEWRKPRDTSVALARLRRSTVCRWAFDGANLEASWLRGSDPARGNSRRSKHTNVSACAALAVIPLTRQRISHITWQLHCCSIFRLSVQRMET